MKKFTLEADVDDYVKERLTALGLKKRVDFNEKSAMSEYLKDALKGSAKTSKKSNFGQPDFTIEKYKVPVIIEDKLHNNRHAAFSKGHIKDDEKSVRDYAVNGAVYYARNVIASKKYNEAVAIGVSGEDEQNIEISVYYVFSAKGDPKFMDNKNFNFLENNVSFEEFLHSATLTEAERHKILVKTRDDILKEARTLNKLMDNFNIGVDQRVVYVSGMLLSMQDIVDDNGKTIALGLTPSGLMSVATKQQRDSAIVESHIEDFLDSKNISQDKKEIMETAFKSSIMMDPARDLPCDIDRNIGKKLKGKASITKQVFTYLYEYVYLAIDMTHGALDIMAEMYSTFLKYALSDGASLGKVLTPPYITTLMARILDINKDSRVMDVATGSAAFLVAAMDIMTQDANHHYAKGSSEASKAVDSIKHNQLLGIEIDAKMYTLAASNMILRGDGSTNIMKMDTFKSPVEVFTGFRANRLLLNPPFSAEEKGLPFFEYGLDHMEKGGLGAVIIMDAAGAGKATATARRILKKHRMVASIKMPTDLFVPNAIVQTSIYVFEAKYPHNFGLDKVKFIDFRNDGYKRTERALKEIDSPAERYSDLYLIYKLGLSAISNQMFHRSLWNLNEVYVEDTISEDGCDWNFERHFDYNFTIGESDFAKTIGEHLSWEIGELISESEEELENKQPKPDFRSVCVDELFEMGNATPSHDKGKLVAPQPGHLVFDYITRQSTNRGICQRTGFIGTKGLQSPGNYSLGLMQMNFFYREKPWYAGQFIKKVSFKDEYVGKIDRYAALYLETALNALSKKLLSVLVRDVEDVFNSLSIDLPIKSDGMIDFDYMSNTVKYQNLALLGKIEKYRFNE